MLNPIPVRHAFSPTSPRVAHDPFHQYHEAAYLKMINRSPTAFERATASELKQAVSRLASASKARAFTALSAATGAGKTTGAAILMAYLGPSEGAACAYIAPTIAVAQEVFTHLRALVPAEVAIYTSIHKPNASPRSRPWSVEPQRQSEGSGCCR